VSPCLSVQWPEGSPTGIRGGGRGPLPKFGLLAPFVEACKRSFRGEGQAEKGGWVEIRVEDGADRGGDAVQGLRDDEGIDNAGLAWLKH
jgi:hypothetical protein